MRFVNDWVSSEPPVLLNFSDAVLQTFAAYVQHRAEDTEAGGLLLGTVHATGLLVTEATRPTSRDRRSRCGFERQPYGHRAIALARWLASGGTVRYLGEWHTHPQDQPRPSDIDRVEWNRLTARRRDGRFNLSVIVGRTGLYVEQAPAEGIGPRMHPWADGA